MSVDRVQKDLICRLLAKLAEVDRKRVILVLKRFQFKMGDVSFMVTDGGRLWTEVWEWPWQRHPDAAAEIADAVEGPVDPLADDVRVSDERASVGRKRPEHGGLLHELNKEEP